MPLFEYECDSCGEVFEIIARFDAAAPVCDKCGSSRVVQRIGRPAPLKTGAFPYKLGPVHPFANKMAQGACATCGSGSSCSDPDSK